MTVSSAVSDPDGGTGIPVQLVIPQYEKLITGLVRDLSVARAFVELLQSENDELKREARVREASVSNDRVVGERDLDPS